MTETVKNQFIKANRYRDIAIAAGMVQQEVEAKSP